MSPGNQHDGDLISTFVSTGDTAAFAELVRRHGAMVYRIARRMTADAHEAEDVAQTVFAKLAERAGELIEHRSIAGWLYSAAWHVAARVRRSAARRTRREQTVARERGAESQYGVSSTIELEFDEAHGELYRAIEMLPPDLRCAIVLYHLHGHAVADIATLLACPPGTITARLSRGRGLLRERLAARGMVFGSTGLAEIMDAERRRVGDLAVTWSCPVDEVVAVGQHAASSGPAKQVATGLVIGTPALAASTGLAWGTSLAQWASLVVKANLARATAVGLLLAGASATPPAQHLVREVRARVAVRSSVTERPDEISPAEPAKPSKPNAEVTTSNPKRPEVDPLKPVWDSVGWTGGRSSGGASPEPGGAASLLLVAMAASLRRRNLCRRQARAR